MEMLLYILVFAVFSFGIYIEDKKQLHMAQLEGYKPKQYWWWIKHSSKTLFRREVLVVIAALAIYVLVNISGYSMMFGIIGTVAYAAVKGYLIYQSMNRKVKAKKPLVFTHRATRLFAASLILILFWSLLGYIYTENILGLVLIISGIGFLLPFNMLLSTYIMYPVEMLVQYGYFKSAQSKIKRLKKLKVIGITGSYGKTSTKYFVKTILSEKYNTLMTPESYNTPMGITKIIRGELNEKHEVFVCEMGARNVGDIKTLGKLANPEIGILTSIGPQHLETFKSIENVAKTKYELIEALPSNGTAIFNGDNKYCYDLAGKTKIETFLYGIENEDKNIFIRAENIRNSKQGMIFNIKGGNGLNFECHTALLGKHNISNILAAVTAALKLGLTPEEIQMGISKIKPVPHRLEILNTNNGVTVIDDAFNSNPVGAREALETIKDLTDGNRIVVTPGMVELGKMEYEENKNFGRKIAECCDYAILVGIKRTKPILEGLQEGNFPEDRIIIASTLDEATARLGQIVRVGDVVLFENDLPDNYNEQ